MGWSPGCLGSSKRDQQGGQHFKNRRLGLVGLNPACSFYRQESGGPGKGSVCPRSHSERAAEPDPFSFLPVLALSRQDPSSVQFTQNNPQSPRCTFLSGE